MSCLICHVVHRFDIGGLENGLINIINNLPRDEFSHAIVAMTESSDISQRLARNDVKVFSLRKRDGKDFAVFVRLFRLFRELRPDILHTRNLGTLDAHIIGKLAGVGARIHSEHGWDIGDPQGASRKYRYLRRLVNPLVNKFVVLSEELQDWLVQDIGIAAAKVTRICNGVDIDKFRPGTDTGLRPLTFGSITRFSEIKDPLNTLKAFLLARQSLDKTGRDARLVMVGDGPLLTTAQTMAREAGADQAVEFVGRSHEVAKWLQEFDVFVLGSKREGISNTILEAMACGLPVVATRTGGNLELVQDGVCGYLVTPESPSALAEKMSSYAKDPDLRRDHGQAARQRAEVSYSIDKMVRDYAALYRSACSVRARPDTNTNKVIQ